MRDSATDPAITTLEDRLNREDDEMDEAELLDGLDSGTLFFQSVENGDICSTVVDVDADARNIISSLAEEAGTGGTASGDMDIDDIMEDSEETTSAAKDVNDAGFDTDNEMSCD